MHKVVSRRVECAHASFQARTKDVDGTLHGTSEVKSTAAVSEKRTGLADFAGHFSQKLKLFYSFTPRAFRA